jgi:hypothetical protein
VVDLFLFLGLSEPPDIRNWFASYVYGSPELDTSNYFGDSLSKDGECECDGVVNEESNTETGKTQSNSFGNNEQRQQSSREVFHLSSSPSFSSKYRNLHLLMKIWHSRL